MTLRSNEGLGKLCEDNEGKIAFLRFNRHGLSHGPLSDWDIAVRNPTAMVRSCEKLLGKPWLRIPRRYVVQQFFSWGQVDFLPCFEWNGVEYLDSRDFWEGVATDDDDIPRPALGHDAFVAWMTGLLWGGTFDNRYRDFVRAGAVEDRTVFIKALTSAFGQSMGVRLFEMAAAGRAEEATRLTSQLRSLLRRRRYLSRPLKTLGSVASHWFCEMALHLKTPYPWIGILGPDGSGKSSVIEGLEDKLKLSRLKIHSVHWAPQFKKNAEVSSMVVIDPHGRPPKSVVPSVLQLGKIVMVWWVGIIRDFIHLRAKQAMVLSDRFYLDLLADPKRYRYGASTGLAKLAFCLIPKPDCVFVLHTDAQTILNRKQEVEPDELERQLQAYEDIAERWGKKALLVDCGMELDRVVETVLARVVSCLEKRSR